MKILKQTISFILLLVLSTVTSVAVEKITYLHNDELGSPVAATDSSGVVLWTESYRPYGQRSDFNNKDTNETWYTGKQHDADLGLSYYGARWYDPNVGRFTGIDPVGVQEGNVHSFNRYAYANGNPYKFVDPDGNEAITVTSPNGTQWYLYRNPTGNITSAMTGSMLQNKHSKLSQLTSGMNNKSKLLITEMEGRGNSVRIVDAKRTKEQQQAKVDSGVSKTMNSKHLDQNGNGADAIDIINRKYGYNDSSSGAQRFFRELGAEAKKQGLKWGGDFGKKSKTKGYGWDPSHVQKK